MTQLEFSQTFLSCNFCAGLEFTTISKRDRYNLPTRSALCNRCGLIAINPRMSLEGYDALYGSGEIHRLSMDLHDMETIPDFEKRYEAAYRFGAKVAEVVKGTVSSGLAVEVGSGTGAVLAAFRDVLGIKEVWGIDPSPEEARIAEAHGVPTIVKTFEACTPKDIRPMTVMSAQSLNHLYDPKAFLMWAHNILPDNGTLVLVVLDFLGLARKLGSIRRATQIDHIYMYTPDSLKQYVASAGFDLILSNEHAPTSYHMTLVAKKTKREPFGSLKIDPSLPARTLESIRVIRRTNIWKECKRTVKKVLKRYTSIYEW